MALSDRGSERVQPLHYIAQGMHVHGFRHFLAVENLVFTQGVE